MIDLQIEPGWTYALKCVKADLTSRNGFQWPESGRVDAPDWSPEAECGNGLHAWEWGEGDPRAATGSMTRRPGGWS